MAFFHEISLSTSDARTCALRTKRSKSRTYLSRTPPAANRPSDGRPLATSCRAQACSYTGVQSVINKNTNSQLLRSRSLRGGVSLSRYQSPADSSPFFSHSPARKHAARASERAAAAGRERGGGGRWKKRVRDRARGERKRGMIPEKERTGMSERKKKKRVGDTTQGAT